MKADELNHSAIFQKLKKDKLAQSAVKRLEKLDDWQVLKQFIVSVKQTLMEASFEVDSLDEIKKYKHLIRGMESIILLPGLVDLVKETDKEDKIKIELKEKEAKRRKYNPGAIVQAIVQKVKGG